MNKLLINFVFVAISAAVSYAVSPVKQCNNLNFEGLEERIRVDPCGTTKCNLPREANVTVNFRFKPEEEVKTLDNDVFATIAGFPLPFLGVHGTDACANVRDAETDKPAGCPLAPGKEYVYRNAFYIYPIYPITKLRVHWSLNDGDKPIICFEVPAAIVKAKGKN